MAPRARILMYWLASPAIGGPVQVVPSPTVNIRNAANTANITDTIYAADDPDPTILAQGFLGTAEGKIEAYLAEAQRCVLRVSKTGFITQDIPVDASFSPNRFTWRGEWSSATTYEVNDVVAYQNASYIAIQEGSNKNPATQTAYWEAMTATVDLTNYARKDQAQIFTEDQTIEAENHLLLGTAGSLMHRAGTAAFPISRNAKFDGVNWVRTVADNDATQLAFEPNGDLVCYSNSDAGNTVGSTITWAERFRLLKEGNIQVRRTGSPSFIEILNGTSDQGGRIYGVDGANGGLDFYRHAAGLKFGSLLTDGFHHRSETGILSHDRIAEATLTSSAATVVFSSIPQTYRSLLGVHQARSDVAAEVAQVHCGINGSVAGTWQTVHLYQQNGGFSPAGNNFSPAPFRLGYIAGASGEAGEFGVGYWLCPDYASTTRHKNFLHISGIASGTSGEGGVKVGIDRRVNTAAITSIEYHAVGGNFVSGSTFTLYGLR